MKESTFWRDRKEGFKHPLLSPNYYCVQNAQLSDCMSSKYEDALKHAEELLKVSSRGVEIVRRVAVCGANYQEGAYVEQTNWRDSE